MSYNQRIVTTMDNEVAYEEVHADSLRFKLAQYERMIARLKEENGKQKEKIGALETEILLLNKDKDVIVDKLAKKEIEFNRLKIEKEALQKTIEIRTQRHVAEQQQNLTISDRLILEQKIKEAEQHISQSHIETEKALKQSHSLLVQIQKERQTREMLEKEVVNLSLKERQNKQMVEQLQRLYAQKLRILEVENRQLKFNMEDLILELKLRQNKQEIDGLLTYEEKIATGTYSKHKHTPTKSYLTSTGSKLSQLPYAETFRERDCRCMELTEELMDYQEMVELMKERNQRLQSELQTFKRRCTNLQGIICGDNSQSSKK